MTIEELERAVAGLPQEELDAFAAWFDAFREEAWDRRIVRDAKAGKLDALAQEALAEHRAGRTRPL